MLGLPTMSTALRVAAVASLLLAAPADGANLEPPSAASLLADVATLAAPEMDGRGSGTPGGDRAVWRIARWLAAMGVHPAGNDGTFFQPFDLGGGRRAVNILGILPGGDPTLAREAIVIGAHWDHDGRVGDVVFPGADDNASGVALVVGLARTFARAGGAPRTLVIALFGAAELDLLGSRRYLEAPAVPLERTVAMLNFDQVGRLRAGRVHVGGVDSGSGLRQLVREAARGGRLALHFGAALDLPSDHARFHRAGVPVLFFFTGRHPDQHRPTDTAEQINAEGMAEIARLATGVVERLASEPRPVHGRLGGRPLALSLVSGVFLGSIAYALVRSSRDAASRAAAPLWMAAWSSVLVNAATDVDQVLALTAAMEDRLPLALAAAALTLPLVALGGGHLGRVGRRRPWLVWVAAGGLVYLGVRTIMADRLVRGLVAGVDDAWLAGAPLTLTAGAVALAWWFGRRGRRRVTPRFAASTASAFAVSDRPRAGAFEGNH